MQFSVNYNDGYEVSVFMVDDNGLRRWHPLRNFGYRQGDAFIFKQEDCPLLTVIELRILVKRYDCSVKYERINGRCFVRFNL